MRILLVEDEEQIRKLMKLNLEMEGYEVIPCDNGKTALDIIEQQHFDLMILDVMLPEISGFQICEKVRLQNNKVAIIIVSAKDSSQDRITGLRLGADDYLTKPFDEDELLWRINAILKRINNSNSNAEKAKLQLGKFEFDWVNQQLILDYQK